jgi:hypothetical protein
MPMENSNKKLTKDLIGIAGVHFVVSELTLRGLVALPTIRNTAGIDILVSEPDGSGQANLQVKTSSKKVNFWPTSRPEKCLKGPRSFYVFLRYIPKEKGFEAFLENGDNVARNVEKGLKKQRKSKKRKGLFPSWHLPSDDGEKQQLQEKWETWRPPPI